MEEIEKMLNYFIVLIEKLIYLTSLIIGFVINSIMIGMIIILFIFLMHLVNSK